MLLRVAGSPVKTNLRANIFFEPIRHHFAEEVLLALRFGLVDFESVPSSLLE